MLDPPDTLPHPVPDTTLEHAQPVAPKGVYTKGTAAGSTATRSKGRSGVTDATRTL